MFTEPGAKEWEPHTSYCIEYPEEILLREVVYHHVAAYLAAIQSVIPYLHKTHHLIGHDVEDEDVQRVIACIDEEALQQILTAIDPSADIVGHQEAHQGGDGERKELYIGGAPVHIGRQVLREEIDDDGEGDRQPDAGVVVGHHRLVSIHELSEDEAAAEEEAAHHVAIATLY